MTYATNRRKSAVLRFTGALLASALMLAGCAQIPTQSQVYSEDISVQDPSPIYYAATGPKTGATPQEIVNGFVSAQVAGLSDKWAVAREFLTNSAAGKWDPSSETNIYAGDLAVSFIKPGTQEVPDGEPDLTDVGEIELKASAQSLGGVDFQGAYTESLANSQFETTFTLVRNGAGEWRISALRDGLLISSSMFETNFRAVSVYFLNPTAQFLVPDVRWFSRVHAETYAVQALISGPVPWLRDSVLTEVPEGTRLISMSVDGGTAVVNLSREILSAGPHERTRFATQITTTLTRIPGVRAVQLKADQLDISSDVDEDIVRDPTRAAGASSNPYVLHRDQVSTLEGRDIVPVGAVGTLAGYDVTGMAIPEDVRSGVFRDGAAQIRRLPTPAAVIPQGESAESTGGDAASDEVKDSQQEGSQTEKEPEDTGSSNATTDTSTIEDLETGKVEVKSTGSERLPTSVLIEGKSLISPSVDRMHWVWSGEQTQAQDVGSLQLSTALGTTALTINVPWLAGRELISLRVSPDGTRLAVISSANGLTHVEVSGIVRDKLGTPLDVGAPVSVGGQIMDASKVAWLDESTVWVLGKAQTDTPDTLFTARVSGPSVLIAPAEEVQTLTASRGSRGVVLGTETGTIRTRGSSGASWSDVAVEAWFPTYPG